jgi:hypothetical protein
LETLTLFVSLWHGNILLRSEEWWLTPVIPATWEVEIGESGFEASPGKSYPDYFKDKLSMVA